MGLDARPEDPLIDLGVGPHLAAEALAAAHNQTHHKFTNIVGQDNDLGYGIMRVDESQPGSPGTWPSRS